MFWHGCKNVVTIIASRNIQLKFTIIQCMRINTSSICNGRRNFRKFPIPNKRGIFEHNKLPKELLEKEYDFPIAIDDMRIRYPGVWFGRHFEYVPEMEPEIIVPKDLDNCQLKPYVSYRATEIHQSEFTAEDLFNTTYGTEIIRKYQDKQSIPESWTVYDERHVIDAKNKALKTGSDLFTHTSYFGNLK
ncbi:39s ribosomal protein l41 [Dermatophagoides farinae]|uniref:39s ribosomal protein l41 n=1 Tax=Dermatophagoides farinae TaxID=6954 RepID=A0A9D4SGA5_DERFA|nr:39S ribosomal protein L41, mitochondrial-like [Dermatophagoides farinae]KAH7641289.1 39s ribosomal protein l41 [Dermatophagoides farinae]